jgi:serine O-acetyltransferase
MMSEFHEFLSNLVISQVRNLLPDGHSPEKLIKIHTQEALVRTQKCISVFKDYRAKGFDYLISWQYATFIYFLAHTIWIHTQNEDTPTRLFLLNKYLNGIDLFFKISLQDHFSLTHTLGSVFSNATYGDYSVYYHGCTIGRNNNDYPFLEDCVVLLPHSMVIGKSRIRENTVITPGVKVIDTDTPGNCYVFESKSGKLKFKELNNYYVDKYFIRPNNSK